MAGYEELNDSPSLGLSGDGVWESLAELKHLNDLEFDVEDSPEVEQLNQNIGTGEIGVAVLVAFTRFAPSLVNAVRDVLVKYIDSGRCKLHMKSDNAEVIYEGVLDQKQQDRLLAGLRHLAEGSKP